MREDVRALIAGILDATGADEAVRLAEDADRQLSVEAARRGGEAAYRYELLRTLVARADVRADQIAAVAGERRATGRRAPDPGPSIVAPLSTR